MILCDILYFLSLSRSASSHGWLALVSKSKSHFWFVPQATGRTPWADQTKSAARAGHIRNAPVSRCRCFLPDLTGFTKTSRAVPNPGDTGRPQVAGNNNSNGKLIHPHITCAPPHGRGLRPRHGYRRPYQSNHGGERGIDCGHPALAFQAACWPSKSTILSICRTRTRLLTLSPAIRAWMPQTVSIKPWRRERDSNPRYPYEYTRFPGVLLQPLRHLSR